MIWESSPAHYRMLICYNTNHCCARIPSKWWTRLRSSHSDSCQISKQVFKPTTLKRLQCPVLSLDECHEKVSSIKVFRRKRNEKKKHHFSHFTFHLCFPSHFFLRHLFKHTLNLFSSCSLLSHPFVALRKWQRTRFYKAPSRSAATERSLILQEVYGGCHKWPSTHSSSWDSST